MDKLRPEIVAADVGVGIRGLGVSLDHRHPL